MIHILILAAGKSSRMHGQNKLAEPVDGVPLLRKQALMAMALGLPVTVALPPDLTGVEMLDDLDLDIFSAACSLEGMSGTLRSAMAHLADARAVLVVLGDLPELEASDLQAVLDARTANPRSLIWRGTTEDGTPGHPILFDRALFPEFAKLKGDGGGHEIVEAAGERVQLVPLPGTRARRDLDTPEDWAAWRAETGR
ncbi:NTP transferase domain-containing protein [Cognatishimia sp. MH4019]|uniref:nucleotidyltransferase family protein n=1 Tax=Cognatishimia sp. MH4019 TaxID=2854030 RepID=UPI001CD1D841|nr:nucleotidyltransferase family protein [Cognatishimia sp. MH4019]